MKILNRNTIINGATGATGTSELIETYDEVASLVRIQLAISDDAMVTFEHTIGETTWVPIAAVECGAPGTVATTATTSGIYQVDCAGSHAVRLTWTGNNGAITATATTVQG